MLENGSVVAGRFHILEVIGAGAQGVVYRAVENGREIALKVLDEPDSDRAQALLAVVQRAATVNHPQVARTLDAGCAGPLVWVAMERIAGRSLAELIDEGPLPPAPAMQILIGVCGALDAAHAAGLLHSDLKPENVIIGVDGPKVTDFGLAGARGRAALEYSAPERSHGYPVDERSDLYSLGVLGYELLTGIVYDTSHEDLPLVLPSDVPAPVRAILIRLLHFDRSARFRSAAAVATALEAALRGGPPPPRPRHGRVLGALLIGAAAAATVFALRARGHEVYVNGAAVPNAALNAYEQRIGAEVPAGRYWYDARSGAWGHEDGPALGLTLPGLELGPPPGPHAPAIVPARALGQL